MAMHLSHIYTTNFGQQSGELDVILTSTTLHTDCQKCHYTGGNKTPNPSFVQKHPVLLVWATSTPGHRNTLPVSQDSTVTQAVLLGFLQLQSNICFLPFFFFLSFLSAVVVAQLLNIFFPSSKQHTTHFHKRKYSKW